MILTRMQPGPVPGKMVKFNPNFKQGFLVQEHVPRAYKILLCLYFEKKK